MLNLVHGFFYLPTQLKKNKKKNIFCVIIKWQSRCVFFFSRCKKNVNQTPIIGDPGNTVCEDFPLKSAVFIGDLSKSKVDIQSTPFQTSSHAILGCFAKKKSFAEALSGKGQGKS